MNDNRMGKKVKVNFPKELVMGPEQIEAINSTTPVTYLIGEAGSGKTTVLLALLYKFWKTCKSQETAQNHIFPTQNKN